MDRLNGDGGNPRSYSSINHTTAFLEEDSWVKTQCNRFLGSDRLVIIHEKQRAFKARRRHGVIHTFFVFIALLLIVVFGSRALLSSDIFEASKFTKKDRVSDKSVYLLFPLFSFSPLFRKLGGSHQRNNIFRIYS